VENLVAQLMNCVDGVVKNAEKALTAPEVQARTPLATITRDCLIRQLWHGDRVLALLRDGQDYAADFHNMELAGRAAAKGLALLLNGH
jgi:exoribonuclease II